MSFKMQTTVYYFGAFVLVICISIISGLKNVHFLKIRSGAPAGLDDVQNLQIQEVFGLTSCAILCSHMSCQEFQYSDTGRLCITRHTDPVPGGVINTGSGLFDTYYKQVTVPKTCSVIRKDNPAAHSGEYTIMPSAHQFRGISVKVYCLMNATHQLEYLTLQNENIGNFPKRSKGDCLLEKPYLEADCVGEDGVTVYQKIRIIPSTMIVVRNDTTFTSGNKTKPHCFGTAVDCYSYVQYCSRIGTFHINTLGTGMKVAPYLVWTAKGEAPKVYSTKRTHGGAVIDLVCGGWPGHCEPVAEMVLYPNSQDMS